MTQMRTLLAACSVLLTLASPAQAEEGPDALALLADRKAICAKGPDLAECSLSTGRAVALVANAIAEAGQTRDRGAFVDLVRAYLRSDAPELRAAAAYALARLAPDATDTTILLALLRDPISAVRDGAWVAAGASSDPIARQVGARFPDRVEQNGYWPDGAPYAETALGLTLPEGMEYLWLSAPRRALGELQFLTATNTAALVAQITTATGQASLPVQDVSSRWPDAPGRLRDFQDGALFEGAQVVPVLASGAGVPTQYVVIYRDRLFGATGLTLILTDGRALQPVIEAPHEPPEAALAPLSDPDAFDAAILTQAGVRPDAPVEETDLYLMIRASGGAAAEDYLELFPDGAYAAEVQALIHAPRLVLDATRYPETGPVLAELANLPAGSQADLSVVGPEGEVAFAQMQAGSTGPISLDISGRVTLGTYLVRAEITVPDSDTPLVLVRDFSVELAMAELRTLKTEFVPGEAIEVEFLGMSGSDQDYVATTMVGAPLSSFLVYGYTGGLRQGRLTLAAPAEPGAYELRAFFREDETILRAALGFTVAGPAVVSPQPEDATTAPDTPAAADDSARATLALDGASYAPGATIFVTYSGMSGSESDYVSTALIGAANASYLQYAYTKGATEGTATLTAPVEPGSYEVRAFFREDETILRGSVPFTVK